MSARSGLLRRASEASSSMQTEAGACLDSSSSSSTHSDDAQRLFASAPWWLYSTNWKLAKPELGTGACTFKAAGPVTAEDMMALYRSKRLKGSVLMVGLSQAARDALPSPQVRGGMEPRRGWKSAEEGCQERRSGAPIPQRPAAARHIGLPTGAQAARLPLCALGVTRRRGVAEGALSEKERESHRASAAASGSGEAEAPATRDQLGCGSGQMAPGAPAAPAPLPFGRWRLAPSRHSANSRKGSSPGLQRRAQRQQGGRQAGSTRSAQRGRPVPRGWAGAAPRSVTGCSFRRARVLTDSGAHPVFHRPGPAGALLQDAPASVYRTLAHLFEMSRNGVAYTPVDAEGVAHGVSAASWARPLWTICEASMPVGRMGGASSSNDGASEDGSGEDGAAAANLPRFDLAAAGRSPHGSGSSSTGTAALKEEQEEEGEEGADESHDASVATGGSSQPVTDPDSASHPDTATAGSASPGPSLEPQQQYGAQQQGRREEQGSAGAPPAAAALYVHHHHHDDQDDAAVRLLRSAPMWCYLYSHEPLKSKKTPPKTSAHMVDMYRCADGSW